MRRSPDWLRWLVIAGIAWAFIALGISLRSDRTPRNLTVTISIVASGAYTLLLYLGRRLWLPRLAGSRPVAAATAIGIFNAALVEALFLGVQTLLGAEGVAAHPNLFMDLLLTMPWYAGMVWIFVRVQRRERYSLAAVLLWGAAYEAAADGMLGGYIVPAILGRPPGFAQHLVFLFAFAFWQFIPVYGSMLLAPALVLDAADRCRIAPVVSRPARLAPGLKPIGWLAICAFYLLGVLVVMGFTVR
jgi:hypothetical protein